VNDDLGPVQIGAREIYDQVVAVGKSVDKLVERHADVVQDVQDIKAVTAAHHADHENRLRALERARWPLPTLAALVGAGGLVVALISLLR
jgi:hypothetical protein